MNLRKLFATAVAFVSISTSISLALSSPASAGNPKFGYQPRDQQARPTLVAQQVAETPATREVVQEPRDARTTREDTCRLVIYVPHKGHSFEKRPVCS